MITLDLTQLLRENVHRGLFRLITCGDADDGTGVLAGSLLLGQDEDPSKPSAAAQRYLTDRGAKGDTANLALIEGLHLDPPGDTRGPAGISGAAVKGRFYIAETTADRQLAIRDLVLSTADTDIAVLSVHAEAGMTDQTRRDACLVSLIGFRHVILLIYGMEAVGYARETHDRILDEFERHAELAGIPSFTAIPVSLDEGANIEQKSRAMDWYQGLTISTYLQAIEPDFTRIRHSPFRLLVESATDVGAGHRAVTGFVAGGTARPGDRVRIQPMGRESRVARILIDSRERDRALAGQRVSIELEGNLNVDRGSVISTTEAPAEVADQFEARIVWLHDQPLYHGRSYLLKTGYQTVGAVVTDIKYELNVETLEHLAANKLEKDGIAICNLALDRAIPFDAYDKNRSLGGFTLIDRITNETMGVGMLHFALRRAHNIHLQHLDIDKEARIAHKGHRPCVLWFTGLSGSGKSTVANLVERQLHAMGAHTYLLDGDNVRHGLSRDLGFTDADRVENIRRVAEVSKLMVDAGLIVITAFISPFRAERRMARQLLQDGEFFEVFTDTPLEVAEQRDPKGLYKKARRGDLKNFTGIDSPYETPEAPELRLDTGSLSPSAAAERVILELKNRGVISSKPPLPHTTDPKDTCG